MTDSPDRSTTSMLEGEGLLSRWSRRKLGQQRPASVTPPAESPPPPQTPRAEAAVEPVPPTDTDLPDPQTLADDSDYSGFLSPRVSQELRRLALRRLFRSARFNNPCQLNEYGGNYTQFIPLGDTVTVEMRHRLAEEALGLGASDSLQGQPHQETAGAAHPEGKNQPVPSTLDDPSPPVDPDRQENS